jgi:hypothetical protein
MRHVILTIMAAAAACAPAAYTSSSAGDVALEAVPSSADMASAYGSALPLETRLAYVNRYVDGIESRLPGELMTPGALRRTQTLLGADAFAEVTDEQFERMDAYYDGADLKRIRMIPAAPRTATEEFYYNDGKLVYVYYEPGGAEKSDPHPEVSGEKYYFGAEGMIAWEKADGTRVDPSNADFMYWSAQLLKEADRFARGP